MKNGFVFSDDNELEFTGAGQLSFGNGMELSQRFAYDGSKRPQTITFRKRPLARTGTINIAFTHSDVSNIFNAIADYEAVCGRVANLYWNGQNRGKYLIKSVQISPSIDAIDIISSVQIGIEVQEGYEPKTTKHLKRRVSIL
ncbi:MAG: hypothetical protein IKA48_11785 [Fibrobacter sp.]|nr:hypothetical protein [Fibrobacter sp.]